ncbi:MAG: PIN domain-containing protein [Pyrinomonadaceae bacterium]
MQYLIDTNIIVQILKGNAALTRFINSLDALIDTTVYVESLQGGKSNTEKRRVKKLVDSFPVLHFTPDISKQTIKLIDKFSNSHNLLLPDAQIVACSLEYDLTLVTYNIKDFRFIADLSLLEPAFSQI